MTTFDNLRRLDSICDSFEANWSKASAEQICQLVQDANQDIQRDLLKQLLWVDLDMRVARGLATEVRIYNRLLTPFAGEFRSAYREYMNRFPGSDNSRVPMPLESASTRTGTQSPMPSNTILGKYEIKECIGSGALGFVYLATELSTRRSVTIKIPNPQTCDLELFTKEAVASSKLTHPNICEICYVEEQSEQPYIVYRFIEGSSLESLIRSRNLSIKESIKIVLKLCNAFEYAHSQGVIHRDIKPANILLKDGLEPEIADFGLAEVISYRGDTHYNRDHGTIYYSAPEQLMGSAANKQSDIFSLGVLLYELIAGRRPFIGESVGQITASVLRCEPSRPSTQNPEVPPALDAVCIKALMKDPRQRFQSMQEFSLALASALRASNKGKNKVSSKLVALGLIAGLVAFATLVIATYCLAVQIGANLHFWVPQNYVSELSSPKIFCFL